MYGFVVRRLVRRSFRRLSAGDYEAVLGQFSPDVVFCFSGEHALGGELRGVGPTRRWFRRLYGLFPGIVFEPLRVVVSGWPWDTVVATRFRVRARMPGGRPYSNEGMQFLRLRWGRVVEDRVYEDTHGLVEALRYLADRGVDEALEGPLTGTDAR